MIFKKKISILLVLTFVMSTLTQSLLWNSALAEGSSILYSQNFDTSSSTTPNGWTIPSASKYIKVENYNGDPDGTPEVVSGKALHASASGSGNRSAYVDIDTSALLSDNNHESIVFDFDFYMEGGVNTCNILTLGNQQDDSYTDLSNTFFALGNGDGVGARNTLRYYNYNTNTWVSIPNVNNQWLKAKIHVDFQEKKMLFELENNNSECIGTYGPFSFSDKFTSASPALSRIVMSGFRTNGGSITLNTWMDNFRISTADTEYTKLIGYNGLVPNGVFGADYSIVDINGEDVLQINNNSSIGSEFTDINKLAIIDADVRLTQLPTSGYQTIFSFNNDRNGNVLVDSRGKIVSQYNSSEYKNLIGTTGKKIKANKWYNIKVYTFLTTSTEDAYNTFAITGDFGNGNETLKCMYNTRNTKDFDSINLSIGGVLNNGITSGKVLFKNLSISTAERPNIIINYNNAKGKVKVDGSEISNGTSFINTTPKVIEFIPESQYDLYSVNVNGIDITPDILLNLFGNGYVYALPLQDENLVIDVMFNDFQNNSIQTTKENEPYSLDPTQTWQIRKYASEARTLQIKNVKMAYRLYKPVGYNANSSKKYPLVVSLHANGKENIGLDNTPPTAGHVEDYLTRNPYATDFPCFILYPQCFDEDWGSNYCNNIAMVLAIIEQLSAEFDSIDTDRIYIGGLSGGGCAVWIATTIAPDYFAAAFSMSGDPVNVEVESENTVPMWTFYAADDSDQGVTRRNREIVNAINLAGGEIISTEYATGGHTMAWTEGLKSPLFNWLFSKSKHNSETNNDILSLISDYNNSLNYNLNINYAFGKEMNNDNCGTTESVLGDIVTDAMREYTSSDIALIRSDDLGSSIEAGNVTEEDIMNALPTKQSISKIKISGSDLMRLLTNAVTYYPNSDGRFLQVSGLKIIYNPNLSPSKRISSVLVNGAPLNTEHVYTVAVSNHLVMNQLNGICPDRVIIDTDYYKTISQIFVDYLNSNNYNTLVVEGNRINRQIN